MSKTAAAAVRAAAKGENVRVAVRCRPLNGAERERGEVAIVTIHAAAGSVTVQQQVARGAEGGGGGGEVDVFGAVAADEGGGGSGGGGDGGAAGGVRRPLTFTFDFAYPSEVEQAVIFQQIAQPIVDSVMEGYNGTIFAYGQTGTGKTHTMEGVADDEQLRGLMPNAFHYIFQCVNRAPPTVRFLLRASFLEIYQDEVYDLLVADGRRKVDIKEHKERGVFVRDLTETTVQGVGEMMKALRAGSAHRRVGATKMNEGSSRSHSILTITVETSEASAEDAEKVLYKVGKLHLVDLAGSERQKQTNAQGERLEEAKSINKSLTVLGNVIKALVEHQRHVPYRDSKLTRLLQDSLGGNTKTVMIANIGPAQSNCVETLSTLRYADRAKQITNVPIVNEDPKDTMLKAFQDEIATLKRMLEEGGGAATAGGGGEGGEGEEEEGEGAEGVSADGDGGRVVLEGGEVIARAGDRLIRTKVVDRVVLVGVSAEEVARVQAEAEVKRRALEEAHQAEKSHIAQRQREVEEAQRSASQQLTDKQQRITEHRTRRLELRRALAKVEGQLIAGQTAVSESLGAEEAIAQHQRALQQQREDKRRLEAQLRTREEGQLQLAEAAEELEAELQLKQSKWERLQLRHQQLTQDRDASRARQQAEREELLTACRDVQRSIDLKATIQRTFMPRHSIHALHAQCSRDQLTGRWALLTPQQPTAEAEGDTAGRVGDGRLPGDSSPQLRHLLPLARPMSVRHAAARASIYAASDGPPMRPRTGAAQPPQLSHPLHRTHSCEPPVSDFAPQRRAELQRKEEEEEEEEGGEGASASHSTTSALRWKVDNIAPLTLDMPDRSPQPRYQRSPQPSLGIHSAQPHCDCAPAAAPPSSADSTTTPLPHCAATVLSVCSAVCCARQVHRGLRSTRAHSLSFHSTLYAPRSVAQLLSVIHRVLLVPMA